MNFNFLKKTPFAEMQGVYSKVFKPGIVLFGHGVDRKIVDTDVQRIQMDYNSFVKAIEILEKAKYTFISMEEFQNIANSKKPAAFPWVLLTFDDGYKNNLTEIYPYLNQKKIPFTIFISANHIINNKRFDNYRIAASVKHTKNVQLLAEIVKSLEINLGTNNRVELLNLIISKYKYFSVERKGQVLSAICNLLDNKEWEYFDGLYSSEEVLTVEQLKVLAADPLVHIGSHGFNHYIQTSLTEDQRMFELVKSRNKLEELLGKTITTFCYPNGGERDFSAETGASCAKAGYLYCFTTIAKKWKPGMSLFEIPRFAFTYTNLPQALIKAPFL